MEEDNIVDTVVDQVAEVQVSKPWDHFTFDQIKDPSGLQQYYDLWIQEQRISSKQTIYIETMLNRTHLRLDFVVNECRIPPVKEIEELDKEYGSRVIVYLQSRMPLHEGQQVSEDIENPNYRQFLCAKKKTSLFVKECPLTVEENWEYGYQYSQLCPDSKMYYLKFFDMLVIDWDNTNLEEVQQRCSMTKGMTWAIYRTHNGYHAILLNKKISYDSAEALALMNMMSCDPFYISFSSRNGFKLRLSPKINREEKCIAERLCIVPASANVTKMRNWETLSIYEQLVRQAHVDYNMPGIF